MLRSAWPVFYFYSWPLFTINIMCVWRYFYISFAVQEEWNWVDMTKHAKTTADLVMYQWIWGKHASRLSRLLFGAEPMLTEPTHSRKTLHGAANMRIEKTAMTSWQQAAWASKLTDVFFAYFLFLDSPYISVNGTVAVAFIVVLLIPFFWFTTRPSPVRLD